MLGVSANDKHLRQLTVDGKVVVGRRLRHRAGVHTGVAHKARAALSGLRAQWAAAWPLVPHSRHPHSRTLERPTLGVRPIFLRRNVTQMYHTYSRNQPSLPVYMYMYRKFRCIELVLVGPDLALPRAEGI